MKRILVCGAGGFIGGAMVARLKAEGNWVRGVDIKNHEFLPMSRIADQYILCDLRDRGACEIVTKDVDEVYQFAADMGGAGFVFTGENDAEIMHNYSTINLNVLEVCRKRNIKNIKINRF